MSRLWRDRLLIALSPAGLALARLRRGLGRRGAETRVAKCDARAGPEPWRSAVALLETVAAGQRGERADVTLVLSNHFVRYALVPRDPALRGEAEILAFARFQFAKVHGERSKSWEVRLDRSGASGSLQVASAIDRELHDALRACFRPGMRLRLASVQPYLMAAFNRWRRQMPMPSSSLLLLEPERACLARLREGRWIGLLNTKGDFAGPPQWARLMDRWQALAADGEPPGEVLVRATAQSRAQPIETERWRFRPLSDPLIDRLGPAEDPELAMALCAL